MMSKKSFTTLFHIIMPPSLILVIAFAISGGIKLGPLDGLISSSVKALTKVGPTNSLAQRATVDASLSEQKKLAYIGASNGKAFSLYMSGDEVIAVPLKTSLPVFKAFGLAVDQMTLLYSPLTNGVPSGEICIENLTTGQFQKISSRLALTAVWSPTNANEVAYTFSQGDSFGLAVVEVSSGSERTLGTTVVFESVHSHRLGSSRKRSA